MKTRTKTLTICLSLALALSACGEQESANDYLIQAQNFSKESQYKESVVALKNAARLAPDDSEIRFLLGQAYLSLGNALDAVKELERAQSLNYQGGKLLPSLARAYLIANDDNSILTLEGVESLADEGKVEYLAYKTLAAIKSQQAELAIESSRQAVSILPANVFAILSQAYVELNQSNIEKADALVNTISSTASNNPEVVMLEAQLATAQQDHVKASERYKRYSTLQPNARIVYLLLADSLLKANQYDEAEKYADIILASLPNQPIANYVKSAALYVKKDYASAVEFAEKAIQGNLQLPQLRLIAGASSFHLGNFEKAHNHLSVITDVLVPEHPAKKMLIVSQFQLGLIDDVTDSLDAFSPQNKDDEKFLSALSFNLYSVGAKQEARKFAEKSASTNKLDPADNARQGVLKLLMNDPSGVDNLELALEENPNLKGAELAIAYAALQSGDLDKAFSVAKKWQDQNSEAAASYNMLAAVYIAQQKIDLAKQALQTSLTKEPDNIFALTELAKITLNEGNKKEAESFAQRAVDKYPNNPKALRYFYAIRTDENSLLKIKQAYENATNNIELTLLYVDALISSNDLINALAVSNTMDASVKTPKKAWLQRVAIYKKQKNELQLVTTIEKWLQANPYHIEPVLMLSDYYVKQRQTNKALQYLDKALLDHHQENLVLKIVKIQLLLDTNQLYLAKKLYQDQQFKEIQPELQLGLAGRIALLEKDFVEATNKLSAFYQAFPSSKNAVLLSMAYKGSNQKAQAQSVLIDYLQANEEDDRIRMMLANDYTATDPTKAIAEYERLIKTQSNNVVVLNNLAWLNLDVNNLELALKYSAEAVKLAPKHPNVLDTRGMVLFKAGKIVLASKALASAYKISEGRDLDISMNYAEVLISNKNNENALSILKRLQISDLKREKRRSFLINLANKKTD